MKTSMKSILSACALTIFAASASFAQDGSATSQDNTDVQNQSYDGTVQDDMSTQDATELENQETLTQTPPAQDEANKTEIAQEELPAEVSDAIAGEEYAEWTVAETYEIDDQGEKKFEVHFETPEGEIEEKTFDETGNVAR